jgi:hypothetical protein
MMDRRGKIPRPDPQAYPPERVSVAGFSQPANDAPTPPPANDNAPAALLALARDLGALAATLYWEGLLASPEGDSPSTNLDNRGNKTAPGSVNREGED